MKLDKATNRKNLVIFLTEKDTPTIFVYKAYQEVSRRPRCGVNAAKVNATEVNSEAAWCMAAYNASIRKPAWPCAAVFSRLLLFRGAWPHATLPSEIIFSRFEVVRPVYCRKAENRHTPYKRKRRESRLDGVASPE